MKFHPSYKTNIDLSTPYKAIFNEVHFANADPGTGKTYASLQLALKHLGNKDSNCILAYASPTNLLNSQFESDLRQLVIDKYGEKEAFSLFKKYVRRIDARRLPSGITVGTKFTDLVLGVEPTDKKLGIIPLSNGSLIIMTHQCVESLGPHSGKERVSLIYDEARQCLVSGSELILPEHLLNYLIEEKEFIRQYPFYRESIGTKEDNELLEADSIVDDPCILSPEDIDLGEEPDITVRRKVKGVYIWRWNSDIPKQELNKSVIREVWRSSLAGKELDDNKKRLNEIRTSAFLKVLDRVRNDCYDVYVSLASVRRPVDKVTQKNSNIKIHVISSPSRMFQGFGKVLVLSAFFTHSQMFYILRNDPSVKLTPATNEVIDINRRRAMHHRMEQCFIVPIFLKESLSKTHLLRSIIVKPRIDFENRKMICLGSELFNIKYRKAFFKDNPHLNENGNKQPPSYRALLNQLADPDDTYDNNTVAREQLINSINYSKSSIIKYMVSRASEIHQAFIKGCKDGIDPVLDCSYSRESLPVVINKGLKDSANRAAAILDLWVHEKLDKIKGIEKVAFDNRGLNKWQSLHSFAFLATMKHDAGESEFLKKVIPSYRPEVDRTLDFCIQSIFRCNIRDPNSSDPCLLIVSDITLAKELVNRLTGLRMLSPFQIVGKAFKVGNLLSYSDPKIKERHKKNEELRNVTLNSEIGKEIRKLNEKIRYWKIKLKDSITNSEKLSAQKNLELFQEQRGKLKLPTRAELRKEQKS